MELKAGSGRVRVSAREGIDLVSAGDTNVLSPSLTVSTLEAEVTARQLTCLVKKLLSLRGKYSVLTAEEDVRIDGDKIGPVPIPYPNMATGMTANPMTACRKIYLVCMPAHNLRTQIPIRSGDNAGVAGGVASGTVMGPSKHLMGSFGVIYEGAPVTKMTSPTGQNGMSLNCPGLTLAPSQLKVIILK